MGGVWLAGVVLWAGGASARPAEVRVGLFRAAAPVAIEVRAEGTFSLDDGRHAIRLGAGVPVVVRIEGGRVVAVRGGRRVAEGRVLRFVGAAPWRVAASRAVRKLAGRLSVGLAGGRLAVTLAQDLDDYVTACAGDEMPPDWPAAALEAQAIASRSFATARRGRHGAEGFDFCDSTHCQRYRGLTGADRRVEAAVARSRGAVLTFEGRPVEALWHAACGGHRAPNAIVFGGATRPYLRGGYDGTPGQPPWCRDAHVEAWRFSAPKADVASALRAAGRLGAEEGLRTIAVVDRTEGGYAAGVRVVGDEATRACSGYALWMALGPHFGWGDLKSPAFTVRDGGDRLSFEGHGLGHGVGMCQWGARGQALAGRSAADILRFYFPGTRLER